MKVGNTYSIQCVTGVRKVHGNGQDLMLIPGEQLETLVINGTPLLKFLTFKLDWRNMQGKEDGMILTCLKLEMEV